MKKDPSNHEKKYKTWQDRINGKIPGINKTDSDIILRYISDMENGINISTMSAKGGRSYARLNNLRQRMIWFSKKFKEILNLDDLTQVTEDQLLSFFNSMKNGTLKREDGKDYGSVETYSKIFKAFWRWHIKVNKKNGDEILDITEDLDTKQIKPKWVYLSEEQVKKLCDNATFEYRVLFTFLLDTGIRPPGELLNVRVRDLYNNCKELNIRDEISKTFGRRIKLMICSELLKEHIKAKELKEDDYLFSFQPATANKYLKRLAVKLFGNEESEAGAKYSEISLYDFRHVACCYWLPRYKSESALKYRFGWKKSDKIHYYSELLGMKDTISEEDLLIDVTKTDIEKRLIKTEKENTLLREKMLDMEQRFKEILDIVNSSVIEVKTLNSEVSKKFHKSN